VRLILSTEIGRDEIGLLAGEKSNPAFSVACLRELIRALAMSAEGTGALLSKYFSFGWSN